MENLKKGLFFKLTNNNWFNLQHKKSIRFIQGDSK